MWRSTNSNSECDRVSDALEHLAVRGEEISAEAVLEQLPETVREHIGSCATCSARAQELTEVRAMFAGYESKAQPSPFFLTRVMASIAEHEAQLEKSAQTWAAVPRLAYRLSVLASLGLLIAGSWVYKMPKSSNLNAQQYAEGLADSGQVQDDLLVGSVSR
jgi:hypothetical protein